MKSSPDTMNRGRDIVGHAAILAGGDTGEQLHILLQSVACFAAQYESAPELLQIAIDTLTAVRDACVDYRDGLPL